MFKKYKIYLITAIITLGTLIGLDYYNEYQVEAQNKRIQDEFVKTVVPLLIRDCEKQTIMDETLSYFSMPEIAKFHCPAGAVSIVLSGKEYILLQPISANPAVQPQMVPIPYNQTLVDALLKFAMKDPSGSIALQKHNEREAAQVERDERRKEAEIVRMQKLLKTYKPTTVIKY